MKVNIVSTEEGWIIRKAIIKLQEAYPNTFLLNKEIGKFDFDYFIPHDKFRANQNASRCSVALFTHLEDLQSTKDFNYSDRKVKEYLYTADRVQYAITMGKTSFNQFLSATGRYPDDIFYFGTDLSKQITFGVCGRAYQSGRKNEKFIADLVTAGIRVISWGKDVWGALEHINTEYQHIEKTFYNKIDYLIIPSNNEGGPISAIEAQALGVPIIAPHGVGYCGLELPVIYYEKNNYKSLLDVCTRLSKKFTWSAWVEKNYNFFNNLYANKHLNRA